MLCCIFNYAPLYRQSIYGRLDEEFDIQFFFGRNLCGAQNSGIEKLDYGMFRNPPVEFTARDFCGRFPWYSGILRLPFSRKYSSFLVTGEFNWAYVPFLVLCRITGKRVYAWGHGLKRIGRYGCFKRFYYNSIATYFIYGSKGRDRMAALGFPEEKFRVIFNSLGGKVERMANAALESGIYKDHFRNDLPVIIFSGRLTKAKKLGMLVKAVSELNAEGCGCNLVIVGDGPCRHALEDTAAGIRQNTWFYGACYDKASIAALQYNADLCAAPGNVGLSAIQSMMYGVPVISHDDFESQMPEYEAIVDGRTGLLYRHGDYADMKAKIRQWLESGVDRSEVRKACYDVIDSAWNSDEQIKIFKEVIDA
ncbi:MAG: glycosyltransferase [Bacteroides sp.]|nr:glycosyltransferase [Bacteroides sp.]